MELKGWLIIFSDLVNELKKGSVPLFRIWCDSIYFPLCSETATLAQSPFYRHRKNIISNRHHDLADKTNFIF